MGDDGLAWMVWRSWVDEVVVVVVEKNLVVEQRRSWAYGFFRSEGDGALVVQALL